MRIGRAFHLMAGSRRLIGRFRLRSALIFLSARLGVAGVTSAINYVSEGRLKVLNAMSMNLMFALIPSRRAALLDPIRALKAE